MNKESRKIELRHFRTAVFTSFSVSLQLTAARHQLRSFRLNLRTIPTLRASGWVFDRQKNITVRQRDFRVSICRQSGNTPRCRQCREVGAFRSRDASHVGKQATFRVAIASSRSVADIFSLCLPAFSYHLRLLFN